MSRLQLLTADQVDTLHNEREEQKKLKREKELARLAEAERAYKLKLPQLIEDYIDYLALVQREQKLPVSVNSPPDGGEALLNERLKPYGLYLASRMTDHDHDPVRYTLTRLSK